MPAQRFAMTGRRLLSLSQDFNDGAMSPGSG